MTKHKIDLNQLKEQAIYRLRNNAELSGHDGVFTPIIKAIIEEALEQEMQEHLAKGEGKNRKNGKARKTIKTAYGTIDIEPSRDRDGSFEPIFLPKRQTTLGKSLDQKIISLYARGMSQADIADHMQELYGMSASKALISNIVDTVKDTAKEWQNRPLEEVYTILWLDASFFKVRENGHVINKAVYSIIGLDTTPHKQLLGMYINNTESASFWRKVLNELQARGVKDVLIACIDNLSGFKKAINAVFPDTIIQQCIVHKIRNSMGSISTKDSKPFMEDLKSVYKASTEDLARKNLDNMYQKWKKKYDYVIESWQNDWQELSAYFDFPPELRKVMYTTNTIESFHSQLRKITKTKRVFSGEESLQKLLYLVQQNITKKWTHPVRNWRQVLRQLFVIFEGRLDKEKTMKALAK